MPINRIANRLKAGNLILVAKHSDGGIWLDAECQPVGSYGYPKGRLVEYVGFGGMERSKVKK